MEQELRNALLDRAKAVCATLDVSEETIGQRALNDNTFFRRIRNGAGFTVKTYDRLMAWMEEALKARADA